MDSQRPSSYLHPSLRPISGATGRSIIAAETLPEGEVLAVWGGTNYSGEAFVALPDAIRQISVQVEEDLFLVPEVEGPAEWVNHSCDPNAGMMGQIALTAMREIRAGEEICYDYAMSDGSPYDEFECRCGAPQCRRRVTGDDWRLPELWERYDTYFSPYLERRIARLRKNLGDAPFTGDGAIEALPESSIHEQE